MPNAILGKAKIWEGVAVTICSNPLSPAGGNLFLADISEWSLKVYDKGFGETAVYTITAQDPTLVMFDSLQLDGNWEGDSKGYSFKHTIADTAYTQEGGHVYVFEHTLVSPAWGSVAIQSEVEVLARGSA